MIKNFYHKTKVEKKTPLKNFNIHHIEECSRILCCGFSGSGKTNSLIQFLEYTSGSFTEVIIFNAISTDEPLYNMLIEKNPNVKLTSDLSQIPELESYTDINNKLIVFDDFIALSKQQLKIIEKYAIASRKKGFTCFFLVQDIISCPKIISRNCNYILLYKMNDSRNIKYLMKLYSLGDVDIKTLLNVYLMCVRKDLSFFMIDLKTRDKNYKYRLNFDQPLKITNESSSEEEN